MSALNNQQRKRLGQMLHARRSELDISASEAARRASVDAHTYIDLENGSQPRPAMQSLQRIASGLGIPIADVLTATEWLPKDELPSLTPYLRTKYHDLPESALKDIEAYFDKVSAEHHTGNGPIDNEDERDG